MLRDAPPAIIVGAGRQGRNALAVLQVTHAVAGYLDDMRPAGELVDGAPVLGPLGWIDDAEKISSHAWFVAIGDNKARKRILELIGDRGGILLNAIHPSVALSRHAVVGQGVYLGAFCCVHSGAQVETGALVEGRTTLGCDSRIGPFARTGPGCTLVAGASLGALSFLGAGAVVCDGVAVGEACVVGANSVVLRSTGDNQQLFGAPARAPDDLI